MINVIKPEKNKLQAVSFAKNFANLTACLYPSFFFTPMKSLYNQRNPQEWQQFLSLLKDAVAEDKAEALFSMFLTADERSALGLRVQITQALLDNRLSQREIQQQLNTSAATITRGSNMLKTVEPEILQWVSEKLNGHQ